MLLVLVLLLIWSSESLIICPVLAALYNAGDITIDPNGNVESADLRDALVNKLGVSYAFATFQSWGVCSFTKDDTLGLNRDRQSIFSTLMYGLKKDVRYLNIFNMTDNKNVRHGFGTAYRVYLEYSIDNNVKGNLNSKFEGNSTEYFRKMGPEYVFKIFISQFANSEGRFSYKELNEMICYSKRHGSYQGEYSSSGVKFIRQWQMHLAVHGLLAVFGRSDVLSQMIGDDFVYSNSELYLTLEDMKDLYIHGRYPKDWTKKHNVGCLLYGCHTSVFDVMVSPLSC